MTLQVRSVSEPTYEENGVSYGTPTNMIETIKNLQEKIEKLEDEISLLTTGCSKSWQEYEEKTDDLRSSEYLSSPQPFGWSSFTHLPSNSYEKNK